MIPVFFFFFLNLHLLSLYFHFLSLDLCRLSLNLRFFLLICFFFFFLISIFFSFFHLPHRCFSHLFQWPCDGNTVHAIITARVLEFRAVLNSSWACVFGSRSSELPHPPTPARPRATDSLQPRTFTHPVTQRFGYSFTQVVFRWVFCMGLFVACWLILLVDLLICLFTHLFTYSSTTYSFLYLSIYSFTQSYTYSFTSSPIHLCHQTFSELTYPFTHLPTHPFTHLPTLSPTRLPTHLPT